MFGGPIDAFFQGPASFQGGNAGPSTARGDASSDGMFRTGTFNVGGAARPLGDVAVNLAPWIVLAVIAFLWLRKQ